MFDLAQQFHTWWTAAGNWLDGGLRAEWAMSLVGITLSVVGYGAIRVWIQSSKKWETEQKRQLMTQIRNILWVVAAFWLVMSWSKTLFPFLFSIVALLVAFVMATKEWILCILGALYRLTTSAYKVGDHVRINNIRGEVIDIHWMQTRVLELGPAPDGTYYSGHVLSFPNSWLMSHHLTNETFFEEYGFHWLAFPLTVADDIQVASEIVTEEAVKVCKPFLEEAHQKLSRMQQSHFMEAPSVEPKIHIDYNKPGEVNLHLRYPAPRGKNNELAQKIVTAFLARYSPAVEERWQRGYLKK